MINDFRGEFAFLSNFAPCEVMLDGMKFQSTEAAYQAAKTLDMNERKSFIYMGPSEAKRAGRKVTLRKDWESVKLDVMRQLLVQKFNQEPYRARLLSTGTQELVEGNWWNDTYWGVCRGRGLNWLGKLLMEIRAELEVKHDVA
jgi:ribA/ribD-fused uncharacterized protein